MLVLEPPGRGSGADHSQPLPVPCSGPPGMRYKAICTWLLFVLGLEAPSRLRCALREAAISAGLGTA